MVKEEPTNTLVDQTSRSTFGLSVEKLVGLVEKYLDRNFAEEIEVIQDYTLDGYSRI